MLIEYFPGKNKTKKGIMQLYSHTAKIPSMLSIIIDIVLVNIDIGLFSYCTNIVS